MCLLELSGIAEKVKQRKTFSGRKVSKRYHPFQTDLDRCPFPFTGMAGQNPSTMEIRSA